MDTCTPVMGFRIAVLASSDNFFFLKKWYECTHTHFKVDLYNVSSKLQSLSFSFGLFYCLLYIIMLDACMIKKFSKQGVSWHL